MAQRIMKAIIKVWLILEVNSILCPSYSLTFVNLLTDIDSFFLCISGQSRTPLVREARRAPHRGRLRSAETGLPSLERLASSRLARGAPPTTVPVPRIPRRRRPRLPTRPLPLPSRLRPLPPPPAAPRRLLLLLLASTNSSSGGRRRPLWAVTHTAASAFLPTVLLAVPALPRRLLLRRPPAWALTLLLSVCPLVCRAWPRSWTYMPSCLVLRKGQTERQVIKHRTKKIVNELDAFVEV